MKPDKKPVDQSGWRAIQFDDVPSRDEFEAITLALLAKGIHNSDQMRDHVRRKHRLILAKTTGAWNSSPSDKFVNEHAHVLKDLVIRDVIRTVDSKEYRLTEAEKGP